MSGRHLPVNPMTRWSALQPYLSGLLNLNLVEGNIAASYYPAREDDWPRAIIRQWYLYNGGVPAWLWPPSDMDDPLNKKLKAVVDQITLHSEAGCFTGKMRHVVQKLHGAGKAIPFTHTVSSSDGVFIPSGDKPDRERQRWIIMIRQDGIYAAPVKFREEALPEGTLSSQIDRYDYYLSETWNEKIDIVPINKLEYDNRSTTCLRLAYADTINSLIKNGNETMAPLVSRYGWAFNYDGTKASIILIGAGVTNYSTFHCEITFSATDKGIPYLSSSSRKGPFPLYTGPDPEYFPFRIPIGDGNASVGVKYSGIPLDQYDNSPVYIYFKPDNTEVILYHSYQKYIHKPDEITDDRGDYYGLQSPPCETHAAVYGPTDRYNQGAVTEKEGRYEYCNNFTCSETFSSAPLSLLQTITTSVYSMSGYGDMYMAAYGTASDENEIRQYTIEGRRADAYLSYHESHQVSHNFADIIGFAWGEAEGFFHYRQEIHSENSYTETLIRQANIIIKAGPIHCRHFLSTGGFYDTVIDGEGTTGANPVGVVGEVTHPPILEINTNYKFGGIVNLDLGSPDYHIMASESHIYAVAFGAFSDSYIMFPWGAPYQSNCGYPEDNPPTFLLGEVFVPHLLFIGDETELPQ